MDTGTLFHDINYDSCSNSPSKPSHTPARYSHTIMSSAMSSPGGSSSDTPSHLLVPRPSNSDYDPSFSSDGRRRSSVSSGKERSKSKPRWLANVKDWLSVSEPSAQALKEQKKSTYKRHGIDPKDPRAAAKMHLPIGKIPETAIMSTRGPRPEKALKQAQQQQQMRESYSGLSQASQSNSSSIYSVPSAKGYNAIAPWESS